MLTSTVSPLLRIGLSAIGMWPGSSYGTFCWFFYMMTLVTMQYFQYSYVYAHLDFSNLTKLMDGLGLTLDYTLTILKLISLWFNRRIFVDILAAMDDDWKNRATDLHECVMTDKANLAQRCSNAMISVNAMATVLYFIDSHVRRRTISMDGHRGFPIQVLHVSGQIDIMCQELKEIPSTFKSKVFSTKSLVERHQKIISLSNNIENYFSFIALLQFIWNSFVICALGFMVVISRSIGDAAYEAVWYDLSTSECRILLFLILRSQKRLTITAGKVMDLTLESFTAVMKASASYISVLHAMY